MRRSDRFAVELLFDEVTDAAIRAAWATIARAGLPSQDGHRHPTNAPHVTVVTVPVLPEAAVLTGVAHQLPLPAELGPALVLGGRRRVVAWEVRRSAELLRVRAELTRTEGPASEGRPDVPGAPRWLPHVTLARGLAEEEALRVLAALPPGPPPGRFAALRTYDATTRGTAVLDART